METRKSNTKRTLIETRKGEQSKEMLFGEDREKETNRQDASLGVLQL